MQKWKYLRVLGRHETLKPASFTVTNHSIAVTANGISVATKEKKLLGEIEVYPDFDEYINQLGEEGWEMVSSSLIEGGSLMATFKRPKS